MSATDGSEEYDEHEYIDEPMGWMDDDPEHEMSEKEERERKILRLHPFLPNRHVIVKDNTHTHRKGWRSGAHQGKAGKQAKVIEVHDNVLEAVKIQFGPDDSDPHFWHYKDLIMAEFEEEVIPPVHFNPLNLVV